MRCQSVLLRRIVLNASLLLLILSLGACGNPSPEEPPSLEAPRVAEIRSAIEGYLRDVRNINPDSMQIELVDVQIDDTEARAVARFSSTEAPAGLEFEYALSRVGDRWAVSSSRPRRGHGAG